MADRPQRSDMAPERICNGLERAQSVLPGCSHANSLKPCWRLQARNGISALQLRSSCCAARLGGSNAAEASRMRVHILRDDLLAKEVVLDHSRNSSS
jgi:hypothetical protein